MNSSMDSKSARAQAASLNHDLLPSIGFWADKNKHGGAWRLWEVARYLDPEGTGLIEPERLRTFVMDQGVSKSSFKRWLKDAYQIGLFEAWDIGRGRILHIVSAEKVARLLGVQNIESCKASIEIRDLFGTGWKSRLWDGHRATCNYRPVSRATSRSITGRSPTTQWRDEKKARIKIRANVVIYDQEANFEWMRYQELEFGRKYLAVRDGGRLMLAKRLPNIYYPNKARACKRGRTRKVASAIGNTSSFLASSLSLSIRRCESENRRLYHDSQKQAACRGGYYPKSVGETMTIWGEIQ